MIKLLLFWPILSVWQRRACTYVCKINFSSIFNLVFMCFQSLYDLQWSSCTAAQYHRNAYVLRGSGTLNWKCWSLSQPKLTPSTYHNICASVASGPNVAQVQPWYPEKISPSSIWYTQKPLMHTVYYVNGLGHPSEQAFGVVEGWGGRWRGRKA